MKKCSVDRILLLLFLMIPTSVIAQNKEDKPKRTDFNGYLKFLQTVQFQKPDENWITDNVFHNRMNFKWYPVSDLTFTAEVRTRLFYGETVKIFPRYRDIINDNAGYAVDLSAIVAEGNSFFIHSVIDRVNLDWSKDKWQVRLGRQRINWGQNFVWNPNDVFNAFSFFDFDYEERPGSDAALVRYYTGATSSIELAAAFGRTWDEYKIAALYRWNRSHYDYQVLTGKVGTDYAVGGGWSGEIGSAGFKGEVTWLEPLTDFLSGEGTVVAAVSADYTFESSLFVHSEIIYNSYAADLDLSGAPFSMLTGSRSPKMLTLTDWSWFNEASYQVTPLFKTGLYCIYNPAEGSVFLGPNAELSLSDNLYLLFLGQFFMGPSDSVYGDLGYFNYLRLKWSF
jgi:hypothetical protein